MSPRHLVPMCPRLSPGLCMVLAALGLTALVGAASVLLQTRYFEHASYFYDHVYYTYFNIRLDQRIERDGRLEAAILEWLTNPRHPLRTVPVMLLAPGLLTARFGHLATSLPCLAAFMALLGLYGYRRSGSLAYGLGGVALFAAIPGLLDPRLGMGAYWLETAAAPLLGSALLCLLLSDGGRRLGWLAAFALFASLACLSRYVTVAYVVVLCGPIVLGLLAGRFWRERDVLRALVLPILTIGIVSAVLAGPFLYLHTADNIAFYSSFAPVGQGKRRALDLTTRMLVSLVGPVGFGALVMAAGVLTVSLWRRGRRAWGSLVLSAWGAGVLPLLLVLQGAGSGEAVHVIWFLVPPLFVGLLAPVALELPDRQDPATTHRVNAIGAGLALVAALVMAWNLVAGWRSAGDPPANVAEQKALDVELARVLAAQGPGLIWCAYFDEYAPIVTLETFYRYNQLVLPAGQPFFQAHAPHWEAQFPGLSPEAIGRRVAEATTRWVDVAAVYDDPAAADATRWLNNPYSRAVSRAVTEEVRAGGPWERIGTVESSRYGRLAVYRNRLSNGAGYERVLRATLRP